MISCSGHYAYLFFKENLQECDMEMISYFELVDANVTGNLEVVSHFLAPGTVFSIPIYSKKPQTGLVKNLFSIFAAHNVSAKDFTLIHVADESPHFQHPRLMEFYTLWKKVYRHNWHANEAYQRLYDAKQLEWYPLGPLRSPSLTSDQVIPSSQRQFNVTFRGNSNTNNKRNNNFNEVQKVLDIKIRGKVFASGYHSTDPSAGDYLKEMQDSRFCLNIRGRTPECHRFYESLDCGCIPVFIDRFADYDYKWQFKGWKTKLQEVSWRRGHELPFIWASDVRHFAAIYDELVNSGELGMGRLDAMQRETLEWWAAAKQHIKRLVQTATCSFPDSLL